jgi:hypothetical protein
MSNDNEGKKPPPVYAGFRDIARQVLDHIPEVSIRELVLAALDSEPIPLTPFEVEMLSALLRTAEISLNNLMLLLVMRAPDHPITEVMLRASQILNALWADAIGRERNEEKPVDASAAETTKTS